MANLGLAMLAFVGTHLILSNPLRAPMVDRLGERGFAAAYSLVSLLTFGWMIWAAWSIEGGEAFWTAPQWFWSLTSALMLPVSILLVGAFAKNPAFPHPGAVDALASRKATGAFAITRHPMNMAFAAWGLLHMATLGSPRNLIIGGGLALLAVVGSLGQDARKAAVYGEAWRGWAGRTSFVPFAAIAAGRVPLRAAWPGWTAVIGGLALWAGASWLHYYPVGPFGLR